MRGWFITRLCMYTTSQSCHLWPRFLLLIFFKNLRDPYLHGCCSCGCTQPWNALMIRKLYFLAIFVLQYNHYFEQYSVYICSLDVDPSYVDHFMIQMMNLTCIIIFGWEIKLKCFAAVTTKSIISEADHAISNMAHTMEYYFSFPSKLTSPGELSPWPIF